MSFTVSATVRENETLADDGRFYVITRDADSKVIATGQLLPDGTIRHETGSVPDGTTATALAAAAAAVVADIAGERTITRADSNTPRERTFGVAASTKVHKGKLACLNSSGYLVEGSATTGLTCVGVFKATVDNSSGSNGDVDATVLSGGPFLLDNTTDTAAQITGTVAGPWALSDGLTLIIDTDGNGDQTATFNTADFADIGNATFAEVKVVIETDTTGLTATESTEGYLVLTSDTSPADTSSVNVNATSTSETIFGLSTDIQSGIADAIADDDVGSNCYATTDEAVGLSSNGSTRSVAGRIWNVTAAGVWVVFEK